MNYPKKRDLDGIYFRVKRNGRWQNVCWTDLTEEERHEVSKDRPLEWWEAMTEMLTETIHMIGNQLNVRSMFGVGNERD